MSKIHLAKLREAVRVIIVEFFENKRGTTRAISETVSERYPELVNDAAEQLVADAIANISRKIMKNEIVVAQSSQLWLPIEISHLRLPAAISIPTDGRSGEDEVEWTPLGDATISEVGRHVVMLQESVAADTRRLRMLSELHHYLIGHWPEDTESPIGNLLRTLAKENPDVT